MAGLVVQLIISWILLWYFDKSNLSALGITPTKKRLWYFGTGFILSAGICVAYNLLTTAFVDNGWVINRQLKPGTIISSMWWVLRSVLFEELIFRGALLYLAIKRFGVTKACVFSAICFGIYHWFSFNAFGNPVTMLIIFLITGIAGLLFAYAFASAGSIYLPIALHFGWNFVHTVVFSNGPLGLQILHRINDNKTSALASLFIFLFQVLALPLLGFLYIHKFVKKGTIH